MPSLLAQLFEPLNKLRDGGRLNHIASIRECLQQVIRKLEATESRHPLSTARHVSLVTLYRKRHRGRADLVLRIGGFALLQMIQDSLMRRGDLVQRLVVGRRDDLGKGSAQL